MKKDMVREFFRNLPDEELYNLNGLFTQRLQGDMDNAMEFLQKDPEVDQFLKGAVSSTDFFSRLDYLESLVQSEARRRYPLPRAGN